MTDYKQLIEDAFKDNPLGFEPYDHSAEMQSWIRHDRKKPRVVCIDCAIPISDNAQRCQHCQNIQQSLKNSWDLQ